MSLTIYDPGQNCQVLNPEEFKPEIINAFHPDYVKTYMPEFLATIRIEAKQKENNQFKSQQIVYCNDDDGKSSFEKDVSRKMASHAVKLVAVPPTPPPVPRINELVVELSPGAVQKQVMQLAKQRSGKKKWFGR